VTLSAGTVSLGVKADTSGFGEQLSTGVMGSSGVLGLGAKIGGAVMAGFAAVGVGRAIGSVFRTGFDEAKDASAGVAQLTAGIQSTGNAANVSVAGMEALASSIQGMSGQTDDSIVKAEQLLLTFTNIKNVGPDKIFDDATLAAANMAAKFGGDASSQAVLLGKALNDPVKGVTALTRVGVAFTQAQRDQIAAMVDAGDTMGAQKIILAELNTEFGGAAEAAGNSLPGQLAKTRRAFEDVTQSLVEGFIPIFTPMMGAVATALQRAQPYIANFSAWMGENIPAAMVRVHDAIAGTFDLLVKGDFTTAFRTAFNVEEDSPVVDVILRIRDAIGGAASAFGPAFATIGAALAPLLPQFLGLWQAVSPLSIVFQALQPILPAVGAALTQVAVGLGEMVTTLAPSIGRISSGLIVLISGLLTVLLPMLGALAKWIGDNSALLAVLAVVIGSVVLAFQIYATTMTVIRIATEAWAAVQVILNAVMAANPIGIIILAVIALVAAIVWVATQTTFFQDAWKVMTDVIGAAWNWLWGSVISPVVNWIVGAWNLLGAAIGILWSAYVQPAINSIGAGFNWVWGNVIQPVVSFISGAINAVGSTVQRVFGGIADFIGGAFRTAASLVRGPMNTIIGLVNGAIDGINAVGGTFGVHLGHIPMLAKGGTITSAGSVIVGENGPELLNLPKGASVNPNIAGGAGAQITNNIELRDEDPTVVARKFAREFANAMAR
jgi:hypothetical protein